MKKILSVLFLLVLSIVTYGQIRVSAIEPIQGTVIKSQGEAANKVLTSNGSGGANWQVQSFLPLSGGTLSGPLIGTTFQSLQVTGTAPFTVASTSKVTNLNVDLLDSYDYTQLTPISIYSYSNGILLTTDIPDGSSTMFTLEIDGNGYGVEAFKISAQGYLYNTGGNIIQYKGFSTNYNNTIYYFIYNGFLHIWLNETTAFQTFNCTVLSGNSAPLRVNRITGVTNVVKPASGVTKEVSFTCKKIWNETSDGALSTLDADLLDGQHGSYYQPLLTNPITLSGSVTANYLTKFTGVGNAIGAGIIHDDGSGIGVGIAASGLAKLHVSTSTTGTISILESSGTAGYLVLREAGAVRGYFGYGDNGQLFTGATLNSVGIRSEADLHMGGTGNNLTMTLTGGNVGIGTTAPLAKFNILDGTGGKLIIGYNTVGNASVIGSKYNIEGGTGGGYASYWSMDTYFDEAISTWLPLRTTLGGKFKIEQSYHKAGILFSYSANQSPVSWIDMMTIKATGNVLINTTTDNGADKLQVTGTASGTIDATQTGQFLRFGQLADGTEIADFFSVDAATYTQNGVNLNTLYQPKIYSAVTATAGATANKVVTVGDGVTPLVAGDLLALKFTGGNSATSMTLAVNGVSAKNILLSNAGTNAVTGTLNNNSVLLLYFDGTAYQMTGSVRQTDSDTYDRTYWGANITAGAIIYDYKIVMQAADGKFYPLTLTEGTGTSKTVSTQSFRINSPILFYLSTTDIAANATFSNVYSEMNFPYLSNSANASSFTSQLPIYLKGTILSDGSFKLDNTTYTSWLTQTLPSTDDGFVYILLGQMYSAGYIRITQNHPIYQYKQGRLALYSSSNGDYLPLTGGVLTGDLSILKDSPALTLKSTLVTTPPAGTKNIQIPFIDWDGDAVDTAFTMALVNEPNGVFNPGLKVFELQDTYNEFNNKLLRISSSDGGSQPNFNFKGNIRAYNKLGFFTDFTGINIYDNPTVYINRTGSNTLQFTDVASGTTTLPQLREAYDNHVVSAAFTGSSTKTLTFTTKDLGTFTASFIDDTGSAYSDVFVNSTYFSAPNFSNSGSISFANASNTITANLNSVAGLIPGNYTNANITVGSDGRLTLASSGSSGGMSDPMTARGDLIYRNSSNVTARLPVGASTYILTSNGTDVSWAAPSLPADGKISNVTISANTMTFTGSNGAFNGTITGVAREDAQNDFITYNTFSVSRSGSVAYFNNPSGMGTGILATGGYLGVDASGASYDLELGQSGKIMIQTFASPPASSSATGTTGTVIVTADYIFVCTATNTWERVALSTW